MALYCATLAPLVDVAALEDFMLDAGAGKSL